MISLANAGQGVSGHVSDINGDARFLSRIISIGLIIGCPVKVLRNEKKQPVLIFTRDTTIALNRKECEKIQLEVDK